MGTPVSRLSLQGRVLRSTPPLRPRRSGDAVVVPVGVGGVLGSCALPFAPRLPFFFDILSDLRVFFFHTHTASALGEEIEKEQSGGRRSALRWKGVKIKGITGVAL